MSSFRTGGDRPCGGCGMIVFASRSACVRCNREVPFLNPVAKKAGDWTCPKCKSLVFASRRVCRQCNTPKPSHAEDRAAAAAAAATAPRAPRPGDWECAVCKYDNFGTRTVCAGCGLARPTADASDDGEEKSTNCVVCMSEPANTMPRCKHLHMCRTCAEDLDRCPTCRAPYTHAELTTVFLT